MSTVRPESAQHFTSSNGPGQDGIPQRAALHPVHKQTYTHVAYRGNRIQCSDWRHWPSHLSNTKQSLGVTRWRQRQRGDASKNELPSRPAGIPQKSRDFVRGETRPGPTGNNDEHSKRAGACVVPTW